MVLHKPGDTYSKLFVVSDATGAAANADATPTITVYRSGTADGTVVVTVTNPETGVYLITFTIPVGYSAGDRMDVLAAVTVGGIAGKAVVESFRLVAFTSTDSVRMGLTALPNAAAAGVAGLPVLDASTRVPSYLTNGSHGGTTATFALKSLVVSNPAGEAVAFVGNNGSGLRIQNNGIGNSITIQGTTYSENWNIGGTINCTTNFPANIVNINGDGVTPATLVDMLSNFTADGGLPIILDAGNLTQISTGVWASATRTLSAFGFTVGTSDAADIAAIKAKTDNLPASPAATGDIPTAIQIRQELDTNSTKLARLDATVSSRLAATAYSVPPTVLEIRNELDANSTKLANLDVTVGSRLAAAGYTLPDNTAIAAIKAKTDNLPASPAAVGDIPTAAAVASQVDTVLTAAHSSGTWGGHGTNNITVSSKATP